MEAGKLDRRITIERATTVTDAFGAEIATWSPVATVWAAYQPVSDGERLRAAEVGASLTARFTIRWGHDVTVEDRIVFDGRTFEVVGVKEIGRREGQEISAAARAE